MTEQDNSTPSNFFIGSSPIFLNVTNNFSFMGSDFDRDFSNSFLGEEDGPSFVFNEKPQKKVKKEVKKEFKQDFEWKKIEDPVLRKKIRNRLNARNSRIKKLTEFELCKLKIQQLEEENLQLKLKIIQLESQKKNYNILPFFSISPE